MQEKPIPSMRTLSMPLVLMAVLAGAACERAPATGELAARVNGQDIAFQGALPERPDALAMQALEHLIDQELLVQKAVEKHLDRDPAVVRQIEEARRQILAKTWVDRSTSAVAPTIAEIHAFYRAHPALFERREIFRTDQLTTAAADAGTLASLKERVARGERLDEIAIWLEAQHLPVRRIAAQRTAEQLPAPVLRRLSGMAPGQMALAEGADEVTVTYLVHRQELPLSLDEAKPVIGELLAEQRRQELAWSAAHQLRAQSNIEYLGAFAEAKKAADAASLRKATNDDGRPRRGVSGVL